MTPSHFLQIFLWVAIQNQIGMTEHYLHVQESIRQSAIQLFSEAFSA